MREFNPQFNATIEFNLYLSYLKVQFKQYLSENIFRDITPNTTLFYQKIHFKYYLMLSENSSNQQWEFNPNSTYQKIQSKLHLKLTEN